MCFAAQFAADTFSALAKGLCQLQLQCFVLMAGGFVPVKIFFQRWQSEISFFLPVTAAWDAVRIQSVHHLLRVMK